MPEAEAAPAPATAPEGPPDRTLELAGLEALLKNHDARLQIQSQEELKRAHEARAHAPQGVVPAVCNWSTHRKKV